MRRRTLEAAPFRPRAESDKSVYSGLSSPPPPARPRTLICESTCLPDSDSSSLQNKRWRNFSLNRRELYEGTIHLESYPVSIMLPTGNRCNLRCQMCIDRSDPHRFRDFSLREFSKYAAIELEYATSVAIYGWGEPLLNRAYPDIFAFVTSRYRGVVLHISSNGTLLNDTWRRRFVCTPNLFLNVSLNAASRRTYAAIMGRDLFEKVIANVSTLQRLTTILRSRFPVITLSFVMMRQNIGELQDFVRLAQELAVDDVIVSDLMCLEAGHTELSVEDISDSVGSEYAAAKRLADSRSDGPPLTLFSDVPYLPNQYGHICTDPWESCKIAENGDVSICCYAHRSFGNIHEQPINRIWNSDDVKLYRATVNSATPPEPCRSCPKKRGSVAVESARAVSVY